MPHNNHAADTTSELHHIQRITETLWERLAYLQAVNNAQWYELNTAPEAKLATLSKDAERLMEYIHAVQQQLHAIDENTENYLTRLWAYDQPEYPH